MHEPTINTFLVVMGSIAAFIFSLILYVVYKGISEWNKNNKAPKISVNVFVKGKNSETHVSSSYNPTNDQSGYSYSPTTTVITRTVTFESKETKRRFVFDIEKMQFDLIFEGDSGVLTYQGTRFIGFKRD